MSDSDWLKTALEITGGIETSGNPWAGITGDFDGMGLSCGVLQWNIGSASLQPLVKSAGLQVVQRYMPNFGTSFWHACNAAIGDGLAIVRGYQQNKRVQPQPLAELRALFGSPEMVAIQMQRCEATGSSAKSLAQRWAHDFGGSEATLHGYCFFFDLLTQNGGMGNLWVTEVKQYLSHATPTQCIATICDWLSNVPDTSFKIDCTRNAALWRNMALDLESQGLFVAAYLRAQKSRMEYRGLTMNRKGLFAARMGWVNQEKFDLTTRL
jgi:hypothetical protein